MRIKIRGGTASGEPSLSVLPVRYVVQETACATDRRVQPRSSGATDHVSVNVCTEHSDRRPHRSVRWKRSHGISRTEEE